jgi:aminoglycoside 3-N-acetyltransferase
VNGGADIVLRALEDATGKEGTLLMVLGAEGVAEWVELPPDAATIASIPDAAVFKAGFTPASVEMGWLAETFRRTPGTLVTDHPIGRFGARGRMAPHFVERVPWHDYYGPGSPLERLCDFRGRVLRLGAAIETVTLLHYAEYLAPVESKRRVRRYVAVAGPKGPEIRYVDSLDDSQGIVQWDGADYFGLLLSDYLATGKASSGRIGHAASELIDATDLVAFAVRWMEEKFGKAPD